MDTEELLIEDRGEWKAIERIHYGVVDLQVVFVLHYCIETI